ncbi:g4406 [Coccomyxa elongata]
MRALLLIACWSVLASGVAAVEIDAGVLTEGCRPCRSSSSCQPLSAPFTRQLQTRNLVPWGTSMAATVCHAGVCVPEAAAEKDSFCGRLAGALEEPQKQEQVGSMQVLGAAVASAAMKMQQELDSSKAGSNRRFLQDQTNTINFSPAPAPMYNVTVPVVGTQTVVTGQGVAQNGGAVFIPSTAVVGGVAQQNVVTTSQPVYTTQTAPVYTTAAPVVTTAAPVAVANVSNVTTVGTPIVAGPTVVTTGTPVTNTPVVVGAPVIVAGSTTNYVPAAPVHYAPVQQNVTYVPVTTGPVVNTGPPVVVASQPTYTTGVPVVVSNQAPVVDSTQVAYIPVPIHGGIAGPPGAPGPPGPSVPVHVPVPVPVPAAPVYVPTPVEVPGPPMYVPTPVEVPPPVVNTNAPVIVYVSPTPTPVPETYALPPPPPPPPPPTYYCANGTYDNSTGACVQNAAGVYGGAEGGGGGGAYGGGLIYAGGGGAGAGGGGGGFNTIIDRNQGSPTFPGNPTTPSTPVNPPTSPPNPPNPPKPPNSPTSPSPTSSSPTSPTSPNSPNSPSSPTPGSPTPGSPTGNTESPSGGSPTVVPPIAPLSAPVDNSYVRATAVNGGGAASLLQTDDRTGSFFQPVDDTPKINVLAYGQGYVELKGNVVQVIPHVPNLETCAKHCEMESACTHWRRCAGGDCGPRLQECELMSGLQVGSSDAPVDESRTVAPAVLQQHTPAVRYINPSQSNVIMESGTKSPSEFPTALYGCPYPAEPNGQAGACIPPPQCNCSGGICYGTC